MLMITALACVSALCQVSVAGFAVWQARRAARFERALRLMQVGPRHDRRTVVAPQYHAPVQKNVR